VLLTNLLTPIAPSIGKPSMVFSYRHDGKRIRSVEAVDDCPTAALDGPLVGDLGATAGKIAALASLLGCDSRSCFSSTRSLSTSVLAVCCVAADFNSSISRAFIRPTAKSELSGTLQILHAPCLRT